MEWLDLRKRTPEPEQEMEGMKEAKNYFSGHLKRHKEGGSYSLVAKNILNNIKINKGNVLDVACGYGALMHQLYKYKPRLNFTGIDLSKAMLKIAKQYCNFPKSEYLLMSADKMDFDDKSFDLVMCRDSFHHFSNPIKVLKEIVRVGKNKIYLTDLRRDSPKDIIYQAIQSVAEGNLVNAMQYIDSIKASYTIKEMKQLLKKAGIKKYNIWAPKKDKYFIKIYNINPDNYLKEANYFLDRWILIIKK